MRPRNYSARELLYQQMVRCLLAVVLWPRKKIMPPPAAMDFFLTGDFIFYSNWFLGGIAIEFLI